MTKPLCLLDRLADKFTVGDGCWEGVRPSKDGYCRVWHDGQKRCLHRIVYELMVDHIPTGYEVDHLCRNPRCCRPAHLEAVTVAEHKRRTGIAAREAHLTCRRGHPYDNVYNHPAGYRVCRICSREAKNRWQREKRQSSKKRIQNTLASSVIGIPSAAPDNSESNTTPEWKPKPVCMS